MNASLRTLVTALLLTALSFAALLETEPSVGIVRDEGIYMAASRRYGAWVEGVRTGDVAITDRAQRDRAFRVNAEHPALMKRVAGLTAVRAPLLERADVDGGRRRRAARHAAARPRLRRHQGAAVLVHPPPGRRPDRYLVSQQPPRGAIATMTFEVAMASGERKTVTAARQNKYTQTWITSSDFGQVVLLGQALQLGKQSNIVICTNIKYCRKSRK